LTFRGALEARKPERSVHVRRKRSQLPLPPAEEQELVERAKRGDHGAYAALVRPHESLALRMGYLITRDVEEAEDAVQEALTRAYFSLRRFRRGSPFRPWLLRIVINEAKDRRRALGRRQRTALQLARLTPTSSTEPAFVDSDRMREVLDALRGLRDEERLVVACRAFLGLSEEETAAALGTPIGTTKSRYARGRAVLRRQLEALDA
jgi:RNA polymerase sigma factor (sigma-70 family)